MQLGHLAAGYDFELRDSRSILTQKTSAACSEFCRDLLINVEAVMHQSLSSKNGLNGLL